MRQLVLAAVVIAMKLGLVAWGAEPKSEREKIDAALLRMENSDLIFIRNDSEHTGKAAADHMRLKLRQAGDSIKTFDDFVDKLATKSSMSGKAYLVKFKDGKTQELAKWLRETSGK
jgi:hypothetical protein